MKHRSISHSDLSHSDLTKSPNSIARRGEKRIPAYGHPHVHGWAFLILCFASISSFSQDVSSHQEDLEVHSRLAQQYLKQDRPELAIGEFQAIVALDPNNVTARGNLGVLLFFRGDYIGAAPQLRAALRLQHDLWNIEALLGLCEKRIGEKSKGSEDLETAFPHLQDDKIKLEAGEELIAIYSSIGKLDKAETIKDEIAQIGQKTLAEADENHTEAVDGGKKGSRRPNYAGDSVCLSCHEHQSVSYLHTAHHLTSQVAGKGTVLGSFNQGSNLLMIHDPSSPGPGVPLYFKMTEKSGNKYETAVMGPVAHVQKQSERIDIVIGSGVRGQSYLYWEGDALYELPVSYWRDGRRWINSPGYIDGTADFSRPIHPRCLECHVTYIEPLATGLRINRYAELSLITGISCETCHGSGTDHVARMRTGPFTHRLARADLGL